MGGSNGDSSISRTVAGIAAAGGDVGAVSGDNRCEPPFDDAAEFVSIAYVGTDLAVARSAGLETTVIDDPSIIIAAYISELNLHGGINGRCIEFRPMHWNPADPVESFDRVCAEVTRQKPLIVLSLGISQAIFECLTLAAELPTMGIYASRPASHFATARGRMFADRGSSEHLFSAGVSVAVQAGALVPEDRLGLFDVTSGNAVLLIERLGLAVAETAILPDDLRAASLLGTGREVRLMEGDFFDTEMLRLRTLSGTAEGESDTALQRIQQYFLETAERFRQARVTAVLTSAGWADVRLLMLAAEQLNWFPRWVINDSHTASLVVTDTPSRQVANLVQISASRAAGDEVADLERGCVNLRNALAGRPAFSHRSHSDAWVLLMATCDYLDVVFAAVSRVDGPLTPQALVAALADTDYRTANGSHVGFGRTDRFGNDTYRLLSVDPDCALNAWGCTRAATAWITPDG